MGLYNIFGNTNLTKSSILKNSNLKKGKRTFSLLDLE